MQSQNEVKLGAKGATGIEKRREGEEWRTRPYRWRRWWLGGKKPGKGAGEFGRVWGAMAVAVRLPKTGRLRGRGDSLRPACALYSQAHLDSQPPSHSPRHGWLLRVPLPRVHTRYLSRSFSWNYRATHRRTRSVTRSVVPAQKLLSGTC